MIINHRDREVVHSVISVAKVRIIDDIRVQTANDIYKMPDMRFILHGWELCCIFAGYYGGKFFTWVNMFSHHGVIYVIDILHSVTIGIMTIPALSTKKTLSGSVILLALMISCMSLASCDDDDDYGYYDIVGKWYEVAPEYGNVYTFYGNGTGSWYDNYDVYEYYIYWSVRGSEMTIDYGDGEGPYYYSWSMQDNTLYLYPDAGGNPIVLQPF